MAQTGGSAPSGAPQHVTFDGPEGWALKYYASTTMMSGLQPPEPSEGVRRIGSITLGLESGWLPTLSPDQRTVGFNGRQPLDLNKSQILVRPSLRVTLPWKLSAVVAAPLPVEIFGVAPHLLAFGLERPIVERGQWRFGWRGSGEVGSVDGAFTCPPGVSQFAPGSPGNPAGCIGNSSDTAILRYAGTELQLAYRIRRMPKLVPHVASGFNFVYGKFEVDAPLATRVSHTQLWTRGNTFSETGGVSYLLTDKVALTVDAFYSPLTVQRSLASGRTNDGLFNVRALLSYSFR
ncbi:MAG: hypothetical protein LAP87_19480 [Acidobacteriia bacterium]|nr:hypothetical protein [Terriglobia bacterium]